MGKFWSPQGSSRVTRHRPVSQIMFFPSYFHCIPDPAYSTSLLGYYKPGRQILTETWERERQPGTRQRFLCLESWSDSFKPPPDFLWGWPVSFNILDNIIICMAGQKEMADFNKSTTTSIRITGRNKTLSQLYVVYLPAGRGWSAISAGWPSGEFSRINKKS